MRFPFLNSEKEKTFLALDIGTEATKVLIYERVNGKIVISGAGLEYFDRFGVFDSRDFEIDVIKRAISKAIKEAESKAKQKPELVLIGLPAKMLKGRVISQDYKREHPEKKISQKEEEVIFQFILKEAQKKISQIQARQFGILPEDIHFLDSKVLEIKIDGYLVPALRGYQGKNLDFRILTIFLPKYYFENFKKITSDLPFENFRIIHEVQGLLACLVERANGIFLDIGGEVTQIFLIKGGNLQQINEFEMGGRNFSLAISDKLGLDELSARNLKERYSQGELSYESQTRMKEILWLESQSWFRALKDKLKEISSGLLLPSDIFIFGGGALLIDIQEIFKKGNWEELLFTGLPQLKIIFPKDLKNIQITETLKNSPQYLPLLFLSYA